jgi:type IV pilus assembly protein PilC
MTFTPGQLNRRAELYSQLGSMITAGVPLIQALQMVSNNSSLRASRKTISVLIEHLKNGLTFQESMARVPGWMPEFDKALLSAGEHAGRLDATFKQLGVYYATRAVIIREAISSMARTGLTLHLFLLIFPLQYFFNFVLGIVNNNYALCIPFIIERIAAFVSLYALIFFIIFACQGNRGIRWRSIVETLTQLIPVLRTAQKYLVLSRLSASLEALVTSGVSIIKSWPLAAAASGSSRLIKEVAGWETELQAGATPAELVSRTHYFPDMFKNFYHTGEISGKLDESLNRLQNYYREEGFMILRKFTSILNWAFYFLVAVLVGYNVIRFWLHYYQNLLGGI